MSAISIRSIGFGDALRSKRLRQAIRKLRFKNGEFAIAEESLARHKIDGKVFEEDTIRMFFLEGPRRGIRGILLASRVHDEAPVHLGVYVDRKCRKKSVGTSLVLAAVEHYPNSKFSTSAWDETSARFWKKLKPMTGHDPIDHR